MTKYEMVDWFLKRQKEGFLSECTISVKQLMDIQNNIAEYVTAKSMIRRDLQQIKQRLAAGEKTIDISKEYQIDRCWFNRYIKGD